MVRIWSASSVFAISAGGLSFDSLHTRCTASGITRSMVAWPRAWKSRCRTLSISPALNGSKEHEQNQRSHRLGLIAWSPARGRARPCPWP